MLAVVIVEHLKGVCIRGVQNAPRENRSSSLDVIVSDNISVLRYFPLSPMNALPLSVNRYFCSLLFGLSGTVISMKPSARSGSIWRLNERESPFIPIAAKISLRDRAISSSAFSTSICVSLNWTWCFSSCLTWCFSYAAMMSYSEESVNSINTPESFAWRAFSIA